MYQYDIGTQNIAILRHVIPTPHLLLLMQGNCAETFLIQLKYFICNICYSFIVLIFDFYVVKSIFVNKSSIIKYIMLTNVVLYYAPLGIDQIKNIHICYLCTRIFFL